MITVTPGIYIATCASLSMKMNVSRRKVIALKAGFALAAAVLLTREFWQRREPSLPPVEYTAHGRKIEHAEPLEKVSAPHV